MASSDPHLGPLAVNCCDRARDQVADDPSDDYGLARDIAEQWQEQSDRIGWGVGLGPRGLSL